MQEWNLYLAAQVSYNEVCSECSQRCKKGKWMELRSCKDFTPHITLRSFHAKLQALELSPRQDGLEYEV